MQTNALRYFLEIATSGSLGKASERLHIATSALSRQILKLENEIGMPLFERRPRGMVLSEAGRLLAAHARRTFLETERITEELRSLAAGGHATVRVASSEGIARDFLPHVFVRFRESHPGVRFELDVTAPADATQRVREGSVDLAVCFSIAPEQDITVRHAQRAPIFALVTQSHALAGREAVSLSDLLPYPLAIPRPGTTIRQLFDICCSLEGISFEPVFVSNYHPSLYSFVQLTDAVLLTGYLRVRSRLDPDRMAAIPISNPELHQRTLQVQTMAGRTLPRTIAAFVELLIEAIEDRERAA